MKAYGLLFEALDRQIELQTFQPGKVNVPVTDASNRGCGGFLCQLKQQLVGDEKDTLAVKIRKTWGEKGVPQPTPQNSDLIGFFSKKWSATESRWSTYDQELGGVCEGVKKWRSLLMGQDLVVFTDYQSLIWLQSV